MVLQLEQAHLCSCHLPASRALPVYQLTAMQQVGSSLAELPNFIYLLGSLLVLLNQAIRDLGPIILFFFFELLQ